MYNVSPLTYVVQSLVAPLVQGKKVVCSKNEFTVMDPPSGQNCGEYLSDYIKNNTGYLTNPSDNSQCQYCPYSYQQEVVLQFNVKWVYRWRNFGLLWAYTIFNFFAMLACYYVMRVKNYSVLSIFKILNLGKWKSVIRKDRHEKDTTIFQQKPGDAARVEKK